MTHSVWDRLIFNKIKVGAKRVVLIELFSFAPLFFLLFSFFSLSFLPLLLFFTLPPPPSCTCQNANSGDAWSWLKSSCSSLIFFFFHNREATYVAIMRCVIGRRANMRSCVCSVISVEINYTIRFYHCLLSFYTRIYVCLSSALRSHIWSDLVTNHSQGLLAR